MDAKWLHFLGVITVVVSSFSTLTQGLPLSTHSSGVNIGVHGTSAIPRMYHIKPVTRIHENGYHRLATPLIAGSICREQSISPLQDKFSHSSSDSHGSGVCNTGNHDGVCVEKDPVPTTWELMKFGLPTLGIWLLQPILSLIGNIALSP